MFRLLIAVVLTLLVFQNCDQGVDFSDKGEGSSSANTDSSTNPAENTQLPSGLDIGIGFEGTEDPMSALAIEITGDSGEALQAEVIEIPAPTIDNLCDSTALIDHVVAVTFPKPGHTCRWNQDGNLGKRQRHFQARIEQKKNLNLPAGAIICDAQFDFVQQDFFYDDHFLLTFNDSVIAASYDFRDQLEVGYSGLLLYDWSRLAGTDLDFNSDREQVFCPVIPGFEADCSFPGHEEQGVINLKYDSEYIKSIMSNGVPENHFFKMVSLGDNNSGDCEHSEVSFDITVKYAMPN